jgi:hypothetical protein
MMLFGVIFFASLTRAEEVNANSILFIDSERIGVSSIGQAAPHDEWIIWPKLEGIDLISQLASVRFSNYAQLKKSSISFRSRNRHAFAVGSIAPLNAMEQLDCRVLKIEDSRPISPELLFLVADPFTMTSSFDSIDKLQSEVLYFAEVRSWDEVELVSQKIKGRVLVVEKPSAKTERWTRFWKKGSGWPSGIATDGEISGLIHSNSLISIVEKAPIAQFPLVRSLAAKPNQLLEIGRLSQILEISFLIVLLISAFVLRILIAEEKHKLVDFGWVIPIFSMLCSSIVLGSFIANTGTTGWAIAWIVLFFILTMIGLVLLQFSPKLREVTLLKFTILCFALTGLSNGHYSPLSPTLGIENRVVNFQFALLLITLMSSIRGSRYLDGWLWITPRLLALGFILHGAFANPAWCQSSKDPVLCVLGFWLYAEGLSGWAILAAMVCSPFQIERLLAGQPPGVVPVFESVLFFIFVIAVVLSLGMNQKFFNHQMKKSKVNYIGSGAFILGLVFIPPLWTAVLPTLLLNHIMNMLQAAESLRKLD